VPNVFPDNLPDRIRQLERDVDELKALLRQRQPLTTASQGWVLSEMSIPSVESDTVRIGCNNADFFARTSSGVTKRMFAQAAAIANQDNFISDNVGGTPNATQYNNLRADAVATRAYVFEVVSRFRASGQMASP